MSAGLEHFVLRNSLGVGAAYSLWGYVHTAKESHVLAR